MTAMALPDWLGDDQGPTPTPMYRSNGIAVPADLPKLPDDAEIEQLAEGLDLSDLADKDLDTLAAEARWHHEQAEACQRQTWLHIVEKGRRLLAAKRKMKLPEFVLWAQAETSTGQAQAYNLMKLARPENLQRVINLPPETSIRGALDMLHEQRMAELAADRIANPRPPSPPVILPESVVLEQADAAALPIPDDLVDLIVTSPPYGLGKDYASTDDNQGYTTYMEYVEAWCAEMYRVAAPQGRVCLNVPLDVTRGGRKPMYADWLRHLLDAGFSYECTIVWNEGNINDSTARGSVDSPSATHVIAPVEVIVVVNKGEFNLHRTGPADLDDEQGHADWLEWTNGFWTFPGAKPLSPDHCPAPFPEELPRRCIKLYSFRGDVVMDPFAGSGTTCVAAARLGRQVYGFDHSPKYIDQARERVRDALQAARRAQ